MQLVVLSVSKSGAISLDLAGRSAGIILLFALAGVVIIAANERWSVDYAGLGITIAALVAMPALAWLKRKLGRKTNSRALVAECRAVGDMCVSCCWYLGRSDPQRSLR